MRMKNLVRLFSFCSERQFCKKSPSFGAETPLCNWDFQQKSEVFEKFPNYLPKSAKTSLKPL